MELFILRETCLKTFYRPPACFLRTTMYQKHLKRRDYGLKIKYKNLKKKLFFSKNEKNLENFLFEFVVGKKAYFQNMADNQYIGVFYFY